MQVYYFSFVTLLMLTIGKQNTSSLRYLLAGSFLFAMAALRGEFVDQDYAGYLTYYSNAVNGIFWNVEPSFLLLAETINYFSANPLWLFPIYAALGVAIKMVAFQNLAQHKMTTLVVYFSSFFLLWEMTQIRVAVAGGILLLSIKALNDRNMLKYILYCFLASFFHYISIVMFALFWVTGGAINRAVYFLLIPAAVLILKTGVNVADFSAFSPIELIGLKMQSYETYKDESDNVFNYLFLSRCLLAYFFLAYSDLLTKKNQYFAILLKLYFIGLFFHVALSSTPLASRVSEFFLVVEVLLIPMIIDIFKNKPIGFSFVIAISTTFLIFSLHYTKLLNPYYINGAFL